MNGKQVEQICKDYGVTKEQLKTAAAVELLVGSKMEGDGDISALGSKLLRVMDAPEMASTIRWATWVKHAQANDLEGQDVEKLLELRKAG